MINFPEKQTYKLIIFNSLGDIRKYPAQKLIAVLTRAILASTKPNAWILDPFAGSSTTGITANLINRKFVGIDVEGDYLELSKNRKLEIENPQISNLYKTKIADLEAV